MRLGNSLYFYHIIAYNTTMRLSKKEPVVKISSISVVLPAYNDSKSIPAIINKLTRFLPTLTSDFEIIIINDASTDDTRQVLEKIKKATKCLSVIHHQSNQGYGATIWDGFMHAKKEFIFYTDGDGQYDVDELPRLVAQMDLHTDMVSGYKINRSDTVLRKIIGAIHNQLMRRAFYIPVKDVDCDFRLFRRAVLKGVNVVTKSGAFDVEFMSRLGRRNILIKEVGVSHYPRLYGQSQVFTIPRILNSITDIIKIKFYEKTN